MLNPSKVSDTARAAQPCCSQRSNSVKLGVVRPGSHGDSRGHRQGDKAAGAHPAAPPSPGSASVMPSETVGTNTCLCASAAAALQPNKWLTVVPVSARVFVSAGDSQRWLQSVWAASTRTAAENREGRGKRRTQTGRRWRVADSQSAQSEFRNLGAQSKSLRHHKMFPLWVELLTSHQEQRRRFLKLFSSVG